MSNKLEQVQKDFMDKMNNIIDNTIPANPIELVESMDCKCKLCTG